MALSLERVECVEGIFYLCVSFREKVTIDQEGLLITTRSVYDSVKDSHLCVLSYSDDQASSHFLDLVLKLNAR